MALLLRTYYTPSPGFEIFLGQILLRLMRSNDYSGFSRLMKSPIALTVWMFRIELTPMLFN